MKKIDRTPGYKKATDNKVKAIDERVQPAKVGCEVKGFKVSGKEKSWKSGKDKRPSI